jgi:hypothetical protein
MITVPRMNKCLFPQTLADGTKNIAEAPTPKRKYPVSLAICVNGMLQLHKSLKYKDNETVFAARIGPRQVANTETVERTKRMRSRFHNGQFWLQKSAHD